MKLAIVSDIHGNLVALEAVVADIAQRGVDLTVNLGDCATSPLWPRETVQLLETLDWPTVRGNHDRWLLEQPEIPTAARLSIDFSRSELTEHQRQALFALPASREIAPRVLAVHGTLESDRHYLMEDAVNERLSGVTSAELQARVGKTNAQVILCGHSHQPRVAMTADGKLVINPGSVGCPRSADHPQWKDVEAGGPMARYAVATLRGSHWSVELISLMYASNRVVARAAANGRRDWVEGYLASADH